MIPSKDGDLIPLGSQAARPGLGLGLGSLLGYFNQFTLLSDSCSLRPPCLVVPPPPATQPFLSDMQCLAWCPDIPTPCQVWALHTMFSLTMCFYAQPKLDHVTNSSPHKHGPLPPSSRSPTPPLTLGVTTPDVGSFSVPLLEFLCDSIHISQHTHSFKLFHHFSNDYQPGMSKDRFLSLPCHAFHEKPCPWVFFLPQNPPFHTKASLHSIYYSFLYSFNRWGQ